MLRPRVTGTALSRAPVPVSSPAVVWVDGGDEVLVHLDSIATSVVGSTVLVAIDLETDQTGRTTLVVAFALGTDGGDGAGLVSVTDQLPRGNAVLVARWGKTVREAAWSALLSLATDHATERGMTPHGFSVTGGQIHLTAATPARPR
jgi:hypothetical protein